MRQFRIALCHALVLSFLFLSPGRAAEYPELNVAPSATQILELEAKREEEYTFLNEIPTLTSGLTTLAAAVFNTADPLATKNKGFNLVGIGVGGAWVGTALGIAFLHRPYQKGAGNLTKTSDRSKEARILQEREAEEVLYRTARFGKRLEVFSLLTNVVASGLVLMAARSGSLAWLTAAFGIPMAFFPVLMPRHWGDVAYAHRTHKKRIYGPLAQPMLMQDPATGKMQTGLVLAFQFN